MELIINTNPIKREPFVKTLKEYCFLDKMFEKMQLHQVCEGLTLTSSLFHLLNRIKEFQNHLTIWTYSWFLLWSIRTVFIKKNIVHEIQLSNLTNTSESYLTYWLGLIFTKVPISNHYSLQYSMNGVWVLKKRVLTLSSLHLLVSLLLNYASV